MKRRHIASVMIVSASVLFVGTTLAQDRFSLRSPNGISFSEFQDYEAWQVIASSMPDDAAGCGAVVPGALAEVAFMVKDSKRFPKTDGWGYATFKPDASSDTWKTFGDGPAFANTCHACHTIVKARDFVFTKYAKR